MNLGHYAEDHHVLPADRTIDVHFDKFMADDMAMVARVYEVADQSLDRSARDTMQAFTAEHPRGKFVSSTTTSRTRDWTPLERLRALSFYSERFGVTPES